MNKKQEPETQVTIIRQGRFDVAIQTPTPRVQSQESKLRQDVSELEFLVDRHGLAFVVEQLARIASDKADHIRSSYDDEPLAKSWEQDANELGRIKVQN